METPPIIRAKAHFDKHIAALFRLPGDFAVRMEPRNRPPVARTDDDNQQGRAATFALRVLFRQNASWQGSVSWMEGNREESFRSVLELLFLMNSALESKKK